MDHLKDGLGGNQRQEERLLHVGDGGQAAEQPGVKPLPGRAVVPRRIQQDGKSRDGEHREGVRVGSAKEDVRHQRGREHHPDRRQRGRALAEDRANESIEQDNGEYGIKEGCRRERELILGADIGVLMAGNDQQENRVGHEIERQRQQCRADRFVVRGEAVGERDLEELAGHRRVDRDEPVEHRAKIERPVSHDRGQVAVVADPIAADAGAKTESQDRQAQAEPERAPFREPCLARASREGEQTPGPSLGGADKNALRGG